MLIDQGDSDSGGQIYHLSPYPDVAITAKVCSQSALLVLGIKDSMGIQKDSNSGGAPHEVAAGVDTAGNVGIGATFRAKVLVHLYGQKTSKKYCMDIQLFACIER